MEKLHGGGQKVTEESGLEKLQGGGENLKDERGEWSNLVFLHFSETSFVVAHLCEGSFMTMCAGFVFFRLFFELVMLI